MRCLARCVRLLRFDLSFKQLITEIIGVHELLRGRIFKDGGLRASLIPSISTTKFGVTIVDNLPVLSCFISSKITDQIKYTCAVDI
jgi:hypothetical protein